MPKDTPDVTVARRHAAALAASAACGLWLGACATAVSQAPEASTGDGGGAGTAGAASSAGDGGAAGGGGAAGDGGTPQSGGDGGTAGAAGSGNDVVVVDPIDDFESGDGAMPESDGRIGAWFTYNDETAGGIQAPAPGEAFVPEAGGPSGAGLAAHTAGNGFTEWGAGIGLDFNNNGSVRGTYDASAYQGVTFWARGSVSVNFKILSSSTTPVDQSGVCSANCEDHHQVAVSLSGSWAQYSFSFAELKQQGWGSVAEFNAKEVISLQFEVEQDTAFDFWVDDIGFY